MVRAGQLRERIEVKREGSANFDSLGQVETAPEIAATVWGQVLPLAGDEAIVARQQEANATHQVTIRYSSDVSGLTPEWWFLWNGQQLQVEQVVHTDLRKRQLVCLCSLKTS